MIQSDPEIAMLLTALADSLERRGRKDLAFKIGNLLELHRDELEDELKRRSSK